MQSSEPNGPYATGPYTYVNSPVTSLDRPRRDRSWWTLGLALLVLGVAIALQAIRLPYAVESPGPIVNTLGKVGDKEMITVSNHKTYPTGGALYFTTVSIQGEPGKGITLWQWLRAKTTSSSALVPLEQMWPSNMTSDEVDEMNTAQMSGSQQEAIAAAARQLGMKVVPQVRVSQVLKGRPAEGKVKVGDVIVAVDGTKLTGVEQVVKAISGRTPGKSVTLTVRRDGAERELKLVTADVDKRAAVGMQLAQTFQVPVKVSIYAGQVGGPSAGMMMGLGIYDELTPGQLNGGKQIAGTGTLDEVGAVGPIGGIRQKLVGARDGGAEYFLAPKSNCNEVVGYIPDGLKVFSVDTFSNSVKAVEAIAKGQTTGLATCSAK